MKVSRFLFAENASGLKNEKGQTFTQLVTNLKYFACILLKFNPLMVYFRSKFLEKYSNAFANNNAKALIPNIRRNTAIKKSRHEDENR